jgi:hypothetical protein
MNRTPANRESATERALGPPTLSINDPCSIEHERSRSNDGDAGAIGMIWLHISSPTGVEAEFTVDLPAMAVDLALRSERAGLVWRAENRADEPAQHLSLNALRALAASSAANDEQRVLLDQIEWQHAMHSRFQLN